MRQLVFILVLLSLFLFGNQVLACGTWDAFDVEYSLPVRFGCGGGGESGGISASAFDISHTPYSASLFAKIREGKIFYKKQQVGELRENGFVLHQKIYRFEPCKKVEVKCGDDPGEAKLWRDGQLIMTADACQSCESNQVEPFIRYLVFREQYLLRTDALYKSGASDDLNLESVKKGFLKGDIRAGGILLQRVDGLDIARQLLRENPTDGAVIWLSFYLFKRLGIKAKSATAEVMLVMKKAKPKYHRLRMKGRVVQVFSKIGAVEEVDFILKASRTKNREVKQAAVQALGDLGLCSEEVVDALIGFLSNKYSVIRATAATSLGKLGSGAVKALPKLEERFEKDKYSVAQAAAKAIRLIGSKEPLPQ